MLGSYAATAASAVPVPSASDLAVLDPAVAITLLVVVGLAIIGVYVRPFLPGRQSADRQPDPASAAPHAAAAAAAALAPQQPATAPINAAEQVAQQFLDHLRRQLDTAEARSADLERRLARRDKEIEDLRQEIRRLETMLWQRQRGDLI